jgi:gamma-carbonic anhydrase
MPVIPYLDHKPEIGNDVFIAPNAWVTGKTTLGDKSSLFFGVVMRGDIQRIIVGCETNFQEHCIVHTSRGLQDCTVGNRVTVGHGAILHGCCIEDYCIIGMGSVILDGAKISKNCIIGAQSIVTMNTVIPEGSLALGNPARVIRPLKANELKEIQDSADSYLKVAKNYMDYFRSNPA